MSIRAYEYADLEQAVEEVTSVTKEYFSARGIESDVELLDCKSAISEQFEPPEIKRLLEDLELEVYLDLRLKRLEFTTIGVAIPDDFWTVKLIDYGRAKQERTEAIISKDMEREIREAEQKRIEPRFYDAKLTREYWERRFPEANESILERIRWNDHELNPGLIMKTGKELIEQKYKIVRKIMMPETRRLDLIIVPDSAHPTEEFARYNQFLTKTMQGYFCLGAVQ